VRTAWWYELLLYTRGGARWPILDSNRRRNPASDINASSLCSVAGYGIVKTVGTGVIGLFTVGC
jgi:hypothetical protein